MLDSFTSFDAKVWAVILTFALGAGMMYGLNRPVPVKPTPVLAGPPTRMEKVGHAVGKVTGHGLRGTVKGVVDGYG